VTLVDGLEAISCETRGQSGVIQQVAEMALHINAVLGHDEVCSDAEKTFFIAPGR
jgi:hypothetical protein